MSATANFWKTILDFAFRKYAKAVQPKDRNAFRLRCVVLDHAQWVEVTTALGDHRQVVASACANACSKADQEFFHERYNQLIKTCEAVESAITII
jgi:hypothetical protein